MLGFDHPDIGLLTLCAQLRALQARWQCLWDATSDSAEPITAADRRFDEFCDQVWPGYSAPQASDLVRRLRTIPATTPDGLQAKAGALRAIYDAGDYSGCCRDDECDLMAAFLREAAGRFFMPLGEAATPACPDESLVSQTG